CCLFARVLRQLHISSAGSLPLPAPPKLDFASPRLSPRTKVMKNRSMALSQIPNREEKCVGRLDIKILFVGNSASQDVACGAGSRRLRSREWSARDDYEDCNCAGLVELNFERQCSDDNI